jgi:protein ImuB
MGKRFISIWFRYLATDWFTLRQPKLGNTAFVLSDSSHGRMLVTAANALAEAQGIYKGMVVADARAIIPGLQVLSEHVGLAEKLLNELLNGVFALHHLRHDYPDGIIWMLPAAHIYGEGSTLTLLTLYTVSKLRAIMYVLL